MASNLKCECGGQMVMVEYALTDKYHYDGVSEEECKKCGKRIGRWCGQELQKSEVEKPYCDGTKAHPRVYAL